MEKRKFIISSDSERRDWEIYEEGHLIDVFGEGFNKGKGIKHPSDSIFAIEDLDKNGKIKGIFDAFIGEEELKLAQRKKRFKEVVDFVVLIDGKEEDRFRGTFIDALEYIKKFFEEVGRWK